MAIWIRSSVVRRVWGVGNLVSSRSILGESSRGESSVGDRAIVIRRLPFPSLLSVEFEREEFSDSKMRCLCVIFDGH
jgi:hypothetical protein